MEEEPQRDTRRRENDDTCSWARLGVRCWNLNLFFLRSQGEFWEMPKRSRVHSESFPDSHEDTPPGAERREGRERLLSVAAARIFHRRTSFSVCSFKSYHSASLEGQCSICVVHLWHVMVIYGDVCNRFLRKSNYIVGFCNPRLIRNQQVDGSNPPASS